MENFQHWFSPREISWYPLAVHQKTVFTNPCTKFLMLLTLVKEKKEKG